jgi:GT2 family glycosyltransferase
VTVNGRRANRHPDPLNYNTMKFMLATSGSFYNKEPYRKELEGLGFTFRKGEFGWCINNKDTFIELNSLDELMAFVGKWGEIVLFDGRIEIYDDYRE